MELVPLSASRVVCLFGETMGGQLGGFRHRDFWFFPCRTCCSEMPDLMISLRMLAEAVRWWFKSRKVWTFLENIALERLGTKRTHVTVTPQRHRLWGGIWCQIPPFFSPKNNLYEHWITLVSIEMLSPSNSGISAGLVQDPWLKT